jgi:hypothetical protein
MAGKYAVIKNRESSPRCQDFYHPQGKAGANLAMNPARRKLQNACLFLAFSHESDNISSQINPLKTANGRHGDPAFNHHDGKL